MDKKLWWTLGVLVLVLLAASYWKFYQEPEVVMGETLKVGALLILSGDFAQYGESSRAAMQIAVDRYNADPRNVRKAEVIFEDTKADPKTALSAYQKLVSLDKVDIIVGPQLQVEMAAIDPLVKESDIPVFSVAPIPQERRGSTANPLVIWPDPTLEANQMADYVFEQGIRSMAIVGTVDSWESEVAAAFEKRFIELGGTVTAKESVLQDSDDVSVSTSKAIAGNPEAIFVSTYYRFTQFVKKLKEYGYAGRLYSIEIDTHLSGETNPYSNGLQFISPEFYTEDFVTEFMERYGQAPSLPAGQSFDAMSLALSIAGPASSRSEILEEMEDIREYTGTSGTITFNDRHLASFPLNIFEIQDGKIIRAR